MLKEYDGLDIDQAISKLKSKVAWDDEDKAFALARAPYLTPGELEAILGDNFTPPAPQDDVVPPEDTVVKNGLIGEIIDDQQPPAPETDPNAPVGPELVDMKMSLAQLQERAVTLDLDSSGVKQELVDRINAFLTEPKQ